MIALLAPLAGLLGCELALRWLVLAPGSTAAELGARFRDAGLYVSGTTSAEYQSLRARIGPFLAVNTSVPQPELGWVNRYIDPVTLVHVDEAALAGRRPVLLFGSSFTSCWHPRATCYQGLFDAAPPGCEFALLNFGVSGYGPDQSLLLALRIVERFASSDPIVIFSLVDDVDLVRATLSVFQTPKPRFVRQGGGWKLELPETTDLAEFARRNPVGIRSYLWRYLRHGVGLFRERDDPSAQRRQRDERGAVSLYCLEEFVTRMRALDLAHFVLLFHSQRTYERGERGLDAEQRRFQAGLARLGIACIDSHAEVSAHLASTRSDPAELFVEKHPNERCTALLYEALMRGLEPLLRAGG